MSALANLALPFEEVVDVVTYDPFGPITAETAPPLGGRFKYTGRDATFRAPSPAPSSRDVTEPPGAA